LPDRRWRRGKGNQTVSRFNFLVIGAGRGGTSLLAGLLDAHPDLTVAFEQFAIDLLVCGTPGASRTPAQSVQEAHSRIAAFRTACAAEAGLSPALSWGNKITTEQMAGVRVPEVDTDQDAIERFLGAHGDVLRVFILRDGRTCVRSKVRRVGLSVEEACRRWQFSVRVSEAVASDRTSGLVIRYEDLVQRPIETLGPVCSFLGVRLDQRMLEGTNNGKMRIEYRQRSLDQTTLTLDDVPSGTFELIERDLRACGYIP
jgi:hypothetical protein